MHACICNVWAFNTTVSWYMEGFNDCSLTAFGVGLKKTSSSSPSHVCLYFQSTCSVYGVCVGGFFMRQFKILENIGYSSEINFFFEISIHSRINSLVCIQKNVWIFMWSFIWQWTNGRTSMFVHSSQISMRHLYRSVAVFDSKNK